MDRIALWFAAMGLLHGGHVLVRVLVAFLPVEIQIREPPLWSVGLYAIGGAAYGATYVGLRRRVRAATAFACLLLAAWLFLSLVALNSGTLDVEIPTLTAAGTVEMRPSPGPVYSAISELWRGGAWIGMLSHPQDFPWEPSGAWSLAEVVAAGIVVALSCAMAGNLLTRGGPGPGTMPAATSPARADTRRPGSGRGAVTRGGRALELALVLHVSLQAVLTIVAVVGVAWKVFR